MIPFPGTSLEWAQRVSFGNILVVEDNDDICEMLRTCIESETTFHVMSLPNAEEALQQIQEIKEANPRLFIFDLLLSTLSGIQLYDSLHALKELEHIPAIIITAATLNLELDRAIAERNLALVLKPFDLVELLDCIERALNPPVQLI